MCMIRGRRDADAVVILGGGVIGLTTAVVLRSLGVGTLLVSDRFGWEDRAEGDSDFATVHAAASILPHSVRSSRARRWTTMTTTCLGALARLGIPGIRTQHHFELFERAQVQSPPYAEALEGFTAIAPPLGAQPFAGPRRAGVPVSGWSFDAMFCERPTYLRGLHDLYHRAGGRVVRARTSIEELVEAGIGTVVVCAGHRSPDVLASASALDAPLEADFEALTDPHPMRYILGHYVQVRGPDLLRASDGRVISYNYHPHPTIYGDGVRSADVYCYPRSDAWLLGGSRVPFDSLEAALAAASARPDTGFIDLPDGFGGSVAIPAPILSLNDELVAGLSGGTVDLASFLSISGAMRGGVGLRAERSDPADSTRVARSVVQGGRATVVVHNYGHGGAGFTLSWGCAVDVCRLVLDGAAQAISGTSVGGLGPAALGPIAAIVRQSIASSGAS